MNTIVRCNSVSENFIQSYKNHLKKKNDLTKFNRFLSKPHGLKRIKDKTSVLFAKLGNTKGLKWNKDNLNLILFADDPSLQHLSIHSEHGANLRFSKFKNHSKDIIHKQTELGYNHKQKNKYNLHYQTSNIEPNENYPRKWKGKIQIMFMILDTINIDLSKENYIVVKGRDNHKERSKYEGDNLMRVTLKNPEYLEFFFENKDGKLIDGMCGTINIIEIEFINTKITEKLSIIPPQPEIFTYNPLLSQQNNIAIWENDDKTVSLKVFSDNLKGPITDEYGKNLLNPKWNNNNENNIGKFKYYLETSLNKNIPDCSVNFWTFFLSHPINKINKCDKSKLIYKDNEWITKNIKTQISINNSKPLISDYELKNVKGYISHTKGTPIVKSIWNKNKTDHNSIEIIVKDKCKNKAIIKEFHFPNTLTVKFDSHF